MAGNTQMNDNERGVFTFPGLIGLFIAVALLLSILAYLTVNAIMVQEREATNYYKVNQDINGLTSGSVYSERKQNTPEEQAKHYILIKDQK